ncbi:hypothetical protein [Streptomyces sp. CNZ287]
MSTPPTLSPTPPAVAPGAPAAPAPPRSPKRPGGGLRPVRTDPVTD